MTDRPLADEAVRGMLRTANVDHVEIPTASPHLPPPNGLWSIGWLKGPSYDDLIGRHVRAQVRADHDRIDDAIVDGLLRGCGVLVVRSRHGALTAAPDPSVPNGELHEVAPW